MATPKIIPYEVQLRSTKIKRNISRPVVYTNDLNSAEFQFKVIDMDAGELSTATATTLLYMRDGSFFQNPKEDVSLVGTTFSYTLKENEGNHGGLAQIQLVVTVSGMEFASQLFDFEIINGLETKVAQEVMIYDWTTLTRDARAYIDQFVADEVFRDAQFDNAQFDRNTAFVASQDARTLAFGTEQTNRGTAFTVEQNERTAAFDESESGRTTAETGRVTAESNRVTAESGRVTKESQRVTAESNRVTAEGNRVTAEGGRVTAESGRVTAETNRAAAFTAFDTRLTAEETATAANKISAVKSKTFADVDARFEDVEADTTMMGTNLVTNGDFSNSTTGWTLNQSNAVVVNGEANVTSLVQFGGIYQPVTLVNNNIYYIRAKIKATSNQVRFTLQRAVGYDTINKNHSGSGNYETLSAVGNIGTVSSPRISVTDLRSSGWNTIYIDNVLVIDLTATFGSGNEPTAEQMDGIMAKFTNSWFNGTANLFRANAALNKLMAVDARTEFDAKNEVMNGDFSKGTDWVLPSGFTIENNELKSTANTPYIVSTQNRLFIDGRKYYFKVSVKNTSAIGCSCDVAVAAGSRMSFDGGSASYISKSVIFTNSGTTYRNVSLLFITDTGDGLPRYCDNVQLIDLTAAFGAGKEPTLAEMDRLMARDPNSWFDGVKPIQTIETLYQEKANKVQEAWITPTLINGWTPIDPTYAPVKYMKDEMGFVHLKGRVKSGAADTIFSLPAGYRVSGYSRFTSSSSGLTVLTIATDYTGSVFRGVGTSTSDISLDGITFRAEA